MLNSIQHININKRNFVMLRQRLSEFLFLIQTKEIIFLFQKVVYMLSIYKID